MYLLYVYICQRRVESMHTFHLVRLCVYSLNTNGNYYHEHICILVSQENVCALPLLMVRERFTTYIYTADDNYVQSADIDLVKKLVEDIHQCHSLEAGKCLILNSNQAVINCWSLDVYLVNACQDVKETVSETTTLYLYRPQIDKGASCLKLSSGSFNKFI